MLMSPTGRLARLQYLPGTFRQLSAGDHVICAVSGVPIPLDALRYWSAELQEAYATPEIATRRLLGQGTDMPGLTRRAVLAGGIGALALPLGARAQAEWPSKLSQGGWLRGLALPGTVAVDLDGCRCRWPRTGASSPASIATRPRRRLSL
jgi:hypothetical protein